MALEVIDSYEVVTQKQDYWALPLMFKNTENFAIFEVNVDQNLDIKAYVLDDDNFRTWTHNLQAQRAGAKAERLPIVKMYTSMTLQWGTLRNMSTISARNDCHYQGLEGAQGAKGARVSSGPHPEESECAGADGTEALSRGKTVVDKRTGTVIDSLTPDVDEIFVIALIDSG